MTKESEKNLELLDRLVTTRDREESIRIAMKLFPEMTRERAAAITDKALSRDRTVESANGRAL